MKVCVRCGNEANAYVGAPPLDLCHDCVTPACREILNRQILGLESGVVTTSRELVYAAWIKKFALIEKVGQTEHRKPIYGEGCGGIVLCVWFCGWVVGLMGWL